MDKTIMDNIAALLKAIVINCDDICISYCNVMFNAIKTIHLRYDTNLGVDAEGDFLDA